MHDSHTIKIDRPIDVVFKFIAELDKVSEWFPPSKMFSHRKIKSKPPVKKGFQFIDVMQNGREAMFEVDIHTPPTQLHYKGQILILLGATIHFGIGYSLRSEAGGTAVTRDLTFLSTPWYLRFALFLMKSKFNDESRLILEKLKNGIEAAHVKK